MCHEMHHEASRRAASKLQCEAPGDTKRVPVRGRRSPTSSRQGNGRRRGAVTTWGSEASPHTGDQPPPPQGYHASLFEPKKGNSCGAPEIMTPRVNPWMFNDSSGVGNCPPLGAVTTWGRVLGSQPKPTKCDLVSLAGAAKLCSGKTGCQ